MTRVNSIFLIADDSDDREIFQIVLSGVDSTIRIMTAFDGVDALEKLNSASPEEIDLIFSDINMPWMVGIECLKKLKKNLN